MEIITSNKGQEKICLNGYMYVLHVKCKTFIRWRCVKYTSLKCGAILKTTLDKAEPVVARSHHHPADAEGIKVVKCLQRMKTAAKTSGSNPAEIFAEGVSTLDNETKARMPVEDSAKRTLRNQRSKINPKDPDMLNELVIEGDWSTTGDPNYNRFLLHDSGQDSAERIIIFATDENLRQLSEATCWYMDGNFSLAPKQFQQLYVIRVAIHDIYVTVVYALLQCKTQVTYESMLHTIIRECAARELYPDPLSVNMDFEKAMINAAKGVLGDHLVIRGCFYHLTQSTHRKIQVLGLETTYREDEAFNLFCGMLDGLAFLPVEDVLQGMDYLRTIMPQDATDLVDYFDTTYVHGSYRRIGNPNAGGPLRFRNIPPLFPPETWNVNATTIAGEERTNNRVEGWNHRFSNLVGHNHPVVWTLIKKCD